MEVENGGRITLRRTAESPEWVDYQGELANGSEVFRVEARVAFVDGAVTFKPEGAEAPPWLVEIARTTLRTAWHGHRAGTEWPRRLTRWRETKEG